MKLRSAALLLGMMGVTACTFASEGDSTPSTPLVPSREATGPGTCNYGPWMAECPEADWARAAIEASGLKVTDETPAAFVVRHRTGELLLTAFDTARDSVEPLAEELKDAVRVKRLLRVGGIVVYEVRGHWLFWSVHGLNIEIAPNSGRDPSVAVIKALARATAATPY